VSIIAGVDIFDLFSAAEWQVGKSKGKASVREVAEGIRF
jgi:hypothetical protein